MRFHSSWRSTSIVWVCLCVMQITTATARLHGHLVQHRDVSLSVVALVFWSFMLVLYLCSAMRSSVELTDDAVRLFDGFKSKQLSYRSIVGVRIPRRANDKIISNSVELETAALAANIYPHTYVRVSVSEANAFAEALHQRVPQAVYEPA